MLLQRYLVQVVWLQAELVPTSLMFLELQSAIGKHNCLGCIQLKSDDLFTTVSMWKDENNESVTFNGQNYFFNMMRPHSTLALQLQMLYRVYMKSGYNLFQQLCTVDSLISAHESPIFMLSGFHHVADENCAHLGYYAVSSGSYRCFGTSYQHHFQGLILEDGTNRMSWHFGKELPLYVS
jgi:hypothetical protein